MPRLKVPVTIAEMFLVKSVIRMPTDGVVHDSIYCESRLNLNTKYFLIFLSKKSESEKARSGDRYNDRRRERERENRREVELR